MLSARAVAMHVDACESSEWQCKVILDRDLYMIMRSLNFCLLTGNSRNITGILGFVLIGICVLGFQVVLKKRQKESILLHFDCISRY